MKNKSLSKNEALQSGVGICRDSVLHKKRIDVYGFTGLGLEVTSSSLAAPSLIQG